MPLVSVHLLHKLFSPRSLFWVIIGFGSGVCLSNLSAFDLVLRRMGSLGGEEAAGRKKAMWLYPKVLGFNPPERWGHSACCLDGAVYVFGGCCGGLHYSDVLTLDLDAMKWSPLSTSGQRPGSRDSHSAALVGQKMVVFGGTNGSKKVNDVHVLDLKTGEWTKPQCAGSPPSPRESHTATVVGTSGEEKMVVFGGSGEGGRTNYLNDVHVLDLKTMAWWSSPEVKGDLPEPRDSHAAVAVGNRILVYGGDCGDRYYGEVDVLDLDTFTWSRLPVEGPSPGVRAGHAAINIGTKVYIIGGVGDKHYYSDVWVLDIDTCSWSRLDVCGQRPQGRFSHTAVVAGNDIAIYGGCGEDERPLNEFLILQLGSDHPNGRYNISMCKVFGNHWSQYRNKAFKNSEGGRDRCDETEGNPKKSLMRNLDGLQAKRRKVDCIKPFETESEQEEHSLSVSQNSSPSQSDQEQNHHAQNRTHPPPDSTMPPQKPPGGLFKLSHRRIHQPDSINHQRGVLNQIRCGLNSPPCSSPPENTRTEQQLLRAVRSARPDSTKFSQPDEKPPQSRPSRPPPLMGAEVRGMVDGAFDSGYLMTANVNGQIFRGVLFAPGPAVSVPRPAMLHRRTLSPPMAGRQQMPGPVQGVPLRAPPLHQRKTPVLLESACSASRQQLASAQMPPHLDSDLHGVILTLGGPTAGNC